MIPRLRPRRYRLRTGAAIFMVAAASSSLLQAADPFLIETKRLTAPDGVAGDLFGYSVAVHGDTAVVGVSHATVGSNQFEGTAYVFGRNVGGPDNWGLVRKLVADDGTANFLFGSAVAVYGDTIVIGAFLDNGPPALGLGSVYIFERNTGGADNWGLLRKIRAGENAGSFGYSVSLDGNTLAVGAPGGIIGLKRGATAFVFERDAGGPNNWGKTKKLLASDDSQFDQFAIEIGVSGDTIVAGANGADVGANLDQGAAYIFERNLGGEGNWGEAKKLLASDGTTNDQFGRGVAISGDTVVAGASRHDNGANVDQGAIYIFERSQGGTGNWGLTKKVVDSNGESGERFGIAVALSGERLIVGGPNPLGTRIVRRGKAFLLERNLGGPNNWGTFQTFAGTTSDSFGFSVALDGATAAVGVPGERIGTNGSQGSASIFTAVIGPNPEIKGQSVTTGEGRSGGGVLATVGDDATPAGNLLFSVVSPPPGITVDTIENEDGRILGIVTAACGVAVGTYSVGLQVTDGNGLTGTGTLTVNVTANGAPSLGTYPATRISLAGNANVTPSAGPTDDNGINTTTASAPGFAGTLTALRSGVVVVSNAGPPGDYTVTVTAADTCGLTATRTFVLTVLKQMATITVNTTGDTTANDGSCSLREAIVAVNTNAASGASPGECAAGLPGTDRIAFNIPGPGPHTIAPTTALPALTESVFIDGFTQPGANGASWPPTLRIELNGSNAGGNANGLTFNSNAVFSTVRGLVINQFGLSGILAFSNSNNIQGNFIGTDATGTARMSNGTGISVFGKSNAIGGTATTERNLISGNGTGVALLGPTNRVEGNFIGTDVTGTLDLGNSGPGVRAAENLDTTAQTNSLKAAPRADAVDGAAAIPAAPNIIGGSMPGAGNLISGNDQDGILVRTNIGGLEATATIQGNLIGTDVTGTARLGNSRHGIWIALANQGAFIGGQPASRNIISANGEAGIKLGGDIGFSLTHTILGNYIGTDVSGKGNLGNGQDGVLIADHTSFNLIGAPIGSSGFGFFGSGSNVIAFNGRDGVRVEGDTNRNSIAYNSIFRNAGLGLNLGSDEVTPNDPGDGDTGPNGLQNFPVLTSASTDGVGTTVQGTFSAKPNEEYTMQFFSNTSDSAGSGEGQTWLSDQVIQTDASGNATFALSLPTAVLPSRLITATAALTTAGASETDYNATSEFSPGQLVEGVGASPPSQLLNISTRLRVLEGENVLIGGFIITGTDAKKVLIRGIGPSLAQFFNGTLEDPLLELYQGNTLIAGNDNWKTNESEIANTGIPPSNDLESAIVQTLKPGAYTAILRGNNNAPGIGLVEAYDLDRAANSKLGNISTRGFVDKGDNVMIGGFIIGGGDGGATVLVRAIGPVLENFGINGALQDPVLELVDANGGTLRANNNWKEAQREEIESAGLPPGDDRECALIQTLAPGNYTAIVRGAGNSTGVALVEVYNVE